MRAVWGSGRRALRRENSLCQVPGWGPSRGLSTRRGVQCGWREREAGEGLSGGRRGRARSSGTLVNGLVTRHRVVWLSQPRPAGEKLEEQLGACHHDAGQTGGGIERENVTGSGLFLEIKPTGLTDGLDVGCDRRVVRMPPALGDESMELVTPPVGP